MIGWCAVILFKVRAARNLSRIDMTDNDNNDKKFDPAEGFFSLEDDSVDESSSPSSGVNVEPPKQERGQAHQPVMQGGSARPDQGDDDIELSLDDDLAMEIGYTPEAQTPSSAEQSRAQQQNTGQGIASGQFLNMSSGGHEGEGQEHSSDAGKDAPSTPVVDDGQERAELHQKIEASASGNDGGEDPSKNARLGDRLVAMGVITNTQLNVALQEKKISGKMLGEVMVDLGFVTADTLTSVLAEASGFGVFDPKNTIMDGEVLEMIGKDVAVKHKILPVALEDGQLHVAMTDPYDVLALDTIRRYVSKDIKIYPLVATTSLISEAIDNAYGYASTVEAILRELDEGNVDEQALNIINEAEEATHPIVRLVNALVFEAVKIGASDLHFEPEENFIRLRYRLDGVLSTAQILHKQYWNAIAQRIKIISGMNIADKLTPQDGRFSMNVGGREADFRVSALPTVHGENIVLRVLDKSSSIMPLSGLGFSPDNERKIRYAQSKPEGIIIVTGPTGSGKTTSLYSMLNEINTVDVNIQTLEDPVEYALPMIRQTHVREGVLEFADGIKALLRQDPDIIFIGEIRDKTTAEMALKAAMTGHQVYTTLHTNDSFGAIPRLLDLGLKPGMIAGAIIAVFAQRLTRRLCNGCKIEYTASAEECALLGVEPENAPQLYKASVDGCKQCAGKGYKGRIAVAEILTFDEEMDELLARSATKAELKSMARKKGFKSMTDDGILKVLEGITSIDAISKVVNLDR